jgi:CBS domain-containing protein
MDAQISKVLEEKRGRVDGMEASATVSAAVAMMNEHNTGSVLIFEGARLIGIFTERDVLTRVVAAQRDPTAVPIGEVMTRKILTISPSVTVREAMSRMTTHRCRHLPVVEDDRVIGVISIGDLTRWVIRDQELAIADLTDFISR